MFLYRNDRECHDKWGVQRIQDLFFLSLSLLLSRIHAASHSRKQNIHQKVVRFEDEYILSYNTVSFFMSQNACNIFQCKWIKFYLFKNIVLSKDLHYDFNTQNIPICWVSSFSICAIYKLSIWMVSFYSRHFEKKKKKKRRKLMLLFPLFVNEKVKCVDCRTLILKFRAFKCKEGIFESLIAS